MPVVPSYRLQVGAGSAPNARLSSPQGRSVAGEQVQEFGQALQRVGAGVGDIALDIQKGVNDLRVQDAINQMTSRTLDLTHGEGGYTRLRQSDVMEMPDGQPLATTYVQRWDEGAAQVESKLSNDAQRQAFRAWAGQQRGQFSKELVTYEARSLAAYEQTVMKDALERDQQVRAVSWEQPEKLPELFEQSENLYVRFAQTQNLPIGVIKGGLGSYRSSIRSQAVMQAIGGGNLELAQVYLNNFKSDMTQEDAQKVERLLTGELERRKQGEVAQMVFAQKPDITPEELDAQLQQRPDLGVSTPEQVAGVKRSVQVMQKQRMEEEEEEEEASLAQSIEHVQQALGDWTKIPVEVKERLSLENVKRVTAYSDSFIKPVVMSDAQVCSQLDTPEFLLQMKDVDFELLRGQLSPDDFEYFGQQRMAYQEAARSGRGLKDSPKVVNMAAVNKQLGSVLQWMGGEKKAGQVGQVSQASGAGQMGQEASPSEPLAAQRAQAQQSFHTVKGAVVKKEFRNEVLSQQMALGRMLSEDELRKTWGEFLGNKVLNSFTVSEGTQRNVLTMQLGDVSAGALLAATESLVDAGVEKPTSAQVFSQVFQNPQEMAQRGRALTSLMSSSLTDMVQQISEKNVEEPLIRPILDRAAVPHELNAGDGVLTADASGRLNLWGKMIVDGREVKDLDVKHVKTSLPRSEKIMMRTVEWVNARNRTRLFFGGRKIQTYLDNPAIGDDSPLYYPERAKTKLPFTAENTLEWLYLAHENEYFTDAYSYLNRARNKLKLDKNDSNLVAAERYLEGYFGNYNSFFILGQHVIKSIRTDPVLNDIVNVVWGKNGSPVEDSKEITRWGLLGVVHREQYIAEHGRPPVRLDLSKLGVVK